MNAETKRVAIITGASKGIGAAIARHLAGRGDTVVVNYVANDAAANGVVSSIQAAGGQAIAVKADIAAGDAMAKLFDAAEREFGPVDVLVNNAATMQLSPIADVDDAQFQRQIDTNVGGTFRGLREAGRRMRNGGRIVNLSSSVVGLYQPNYGVYAATKAAVEAMTHVFAKELGARGITVNAVAPGPVDTDLFKAGKSAALVDQITRMIPLGRLGAPDDIAAIVSFLTSAAGGWVNGQVVRTNGGVV